MPATPTTPGFDYNGLPKAFVNASQKRAAKIKQIDVETGRNFLEMGRVLSEQRSAFGSSISKCQARGKDTWDAWVKAELGWATGRTYANRVIKVFDVFGEQQWCSALGLHTLSLLTSEKAAPVRKRVKEMIEAGETPTVLQIKQMKKDLTPDDRPTPTEAKAKAKETGEVVIGSDNRIYTPIEEGDAAAYEERRDRTYETIDAIKQVSTLPVNASSWLAGADMHWLSDLNLGEIEAAQNWLASLAAEYRKKEGIIDGH